MRSLRQKVELSIVKKLFKITLLAVTLVSLLSSAAFADVRGVPITQFANVAASGPSSGGTGSGSTTSNNCGVQQNALCPVCQSSSAPSSGCISSQTDSAATCNKGNCDLVAKYINPAIDLLSVIFGLLAVISFILGAVNFTMSEGDPQKVSKAKQRIFNTVLAVFAYVFFYAFLQFLVPGGLFNR